MASFYLSKTPQAVIILSRPLVARFVTECEVSGPRGSQRRACVYNLHNHFVYKRTCAVRIRCRTDRGQTWRNGLSNQLLPTSREQKVKPTVSNTFVKHFQLSATNQ
ncbi:unnamed protein product [Pieris macdunnoughi]|uniref:Uncharacterized protein n=1 Tax=Pieris macdunnoughi TaxID=345717 RepID=A0A821YD84_9NEOP|nr:unnamed protein product [Pieris macdunnoughi]